MTGCGELLNLANGRCLEQLRHHDVRQEFLQKAVDHAGAVDSPHNQEHDGKGEDEDDKGGGCETLDHDGFLPEIRLQFYGGEGPTCALWSKQRR